MNTLEIILKCAEEAAKEKFFNVSTGWPQYLINADVFISALKREIEEKDLANEVAKKNMEITNEFIQRET